MGYRNRFNLRRWSAFNFCKVGLFLIVSTLLMFFLLIACTGPTAYFRQSQEVALLFEQGQLQADHRYYVGGPSAKPNAVVAISNEFNLASDSWKEIVVDREALASLIRRVGIVSGAEEKARQVPNGAKILTPDGKLVGMWYSVYDYSVVRLSADNTIHLSYPTSTLPYGINTEGRRS